MSGKKKKKPKPLQFSRRAAAGWSGLFLVLGVALFVLGVLVGRGTSPLHFDIAKLEKQLLALKNTQMEEDRRRYRIDDKPEVSRKEMDFHEELREVGKDIRPAPEPVPKKETPPPGPGGEPSTDPPAVKTTPAAAVPGPKPVSPPTVVHGGAFTLQVGSMRDAKTAARMVIKLKKKGYPAFSSPGQVAGKGTWYRVRIGSFDHRSEAARLQVRLQRENVQTVLVPAN